MFVWDADICKKSCCDNKCSCVTCFPFRCTWLSIARDKSCSGGTACVPPSLFCRIHTGGATVNDGCIVSPCYCEMWKNYYSSDIDQQMHVCPFRCCFVRDRDYDTIMHPRRQNNDKDAMSCSPCHYLNSTVSTRNAYNRYDDDDAISRDDLEARYSREVNRPRYAVTDRVERISVCCGCCDTKVTTTRLSTIELIPPERVRMDMEADIMNVLVASEKVPNAIATLIMTFLSKKKEQSCSL